MKIDQVKDLIEQGIPNSNVEVDGDGVHFEAVVVSEQFSGLNRIKRQQIVYSTVNEYVQSGELHALSMKTYTPEEWQAKNG